MCVRQLGSRFHWFVVSLFSAFDSLLLLDALWSPPCPGGAARSSLQYLLGVPTNHLGARTGKYACSGLVTVPCGGQLCLGFRGNLQIQRPPIRIDKRAASYGEPTLRHLSDGSAHVLRGPSDADRVATAGER